MDDLAVKVEGIDQRCKSNTHRINDLETQRDILQDLATSVKLMAQSMTSMEKEQEKQGKRLAALEKQPADKWNLLVRTIITALAGGAIGMLITLL